MAEDALKITSDRAVVAALKRGRSAWYGTTGAPGLRLKVHASASGETSASWVLRFKGRQLGGGVKNFGLGAYPAVSLKEARRKAADYMSLCRQGIDPRERKPAAAAETVQEQPSPTVRDLMEEWLDFKLAHGDWKNEKRRKQEDSRMRTHVLPGLGGRPASDVTPEDVVELLRPIWNTATGEKVQINLKGFFQWVRAVKGLRQDNPADSAQIEVAAHGTLPKKQRSQRPHPMLLPERMPELLTGITRRHGDSYRALEFNILTALRSGVQQYVSWDWITETEGGPVLVIPAARMKVQENGIHKIPLSRQAADILRRQREALLARGYDGPLVFPGATGKGVTVEAIEGALRRVHADNLTAGGKGFFDAVQSIEAGEPVRADVHGISRATFETWAREFHRGLGAAIDLCLHHRIDTRYSGAYDRHDYMAEKRTLLQSWGDFCKPAEKR